jgi:hypothetical protein
MPVSTGPRRVVAPRAATATVPLAAVMMRVGVTEMGARKGLPLDRASLIGIVHLHDTRQALVRLVGGSVRTVSTGDVIEGWKVSLIGLDALRLTRGGEVQTLVLVSR